MKSEGDIKHKAFKKGKTSNKHRYTNETQPTTRAWSAGTPVVRVRHEPPVGRAVLGIAEVPAQPPPLEAHRVGAYRLFEVSLVTEVPLCERLQHGGV